MSGGLNALPEINISVVCGRNPRSKFWVSSMGKLQLPGPTITLRPRLTHTKFIMNTCLIIKYLL